MVATLGEEPRGNPPTDWQCTGTRLEDLTKQQRMVLGMGEFKGIEYRVEANHSGAPQGPTPQGRKEQASIIEIPKNEMNQQKPAGKTPASGSANDIYIFCSLSTYKHILMRGNEQRRQRSLGRARRGVCLRCRGLGFGLQLR